jgi:hypothetical protein
MTIANMHNLRRLLIPAFALKLTLAALALSLATLLVGVTGNNPKAAPIAIVRRPTSLA